MGKSTAASFLVNRGVTIVDTDLLARQLVEPGQPALIEIRQAFGAEILAADGSLRRDRLAQRVFSEPTARKTLESILHPRIRDLWLSERDAWRSNFAKTLPQDSSPLHPRDGMRSVRFFCVVIPLLFETRAEVEIDASICLACSSITQRQRLLARGWNADHIAQRIQSQLPIEEKMTRAPYVVWNEGSVEILNAQLERVLRSAADGR